MDDVLNHQIEFLSDALRASKISSRDTDFVSSLVNAANTRGLSEKQSHWVGVLFDRYNKPAPAPVGKKIGDLAGVFHLFDTAAQTLNFPKVLVETLDGTQVKLSVAGDSARIPGSINVVNRDTDEWLGRILQDGTFVQSSRAEHVPAGLEDTLVDFAKRPAEVAATYGKKTGCCCFCARELTDSRSVEVGYGPICAENFGLPWGA